MNYKEFVEKIRELHKEVQSKSINIIENNIDLEELEGLSLEARCFVFEELEDSYKIKLSNKLKDMFIPGNLHVCWHYIINKNRQTGGEFSFIGTPGLFVNTAKTAFKNDLSPFGKKLYNQGYRFFDSHPHAGDAEVFSFLLDKNKMTSNIYHIDLKTEDISLMEIDYFQYIEHSIVLKGLYGWQYLFEEINFKNLDIDLSGLGRRLEDYNKLFPDVDMSNYLNRYKERGGV